MAKIVKTLNLTVTGNGAQVIPLDFTRYNDLRVQLNVTAASGVSPTLDVTVQDTLDGTNFNDIITFAQKTGVAREVANTTSTFGHSLRIAYTLSGTTPEFTFKIDIVAK